MVPWAGSGTLWEATPKLHPKVSRMGQAESLNCKQAKGTLRRDVEDEKAGGQSSRPISEILEGRPRRRG